MPQDYGRFLAVNVSRLYYQERVCAIHELHGRTSCSGVISLDAYNALG